MDERIIICADVIAEYNGKIVLVRRLDTPAGLAFPGGKQNPNELLSQTARREMIEETGLNLLIEGVLSTFAKTHRDPRGRRISTVFTGYAAGTPKNEPEKTEIILVAIEKISGLKNHLIFDHGKILDRYLETKKIGTGGSKNG